ncbi:hypothetical protein TNCV_2991321 [Trichonephila clavipes]|uniref:Uncharacterized protein n=1 Tax=Trichonephila clavipes TaxID=2585209 RepID=A0A8X6VE25_TRICX|nr:hypothetical protein TNCV_2991321 [Trichonephila clavipes]
MPMASYIFRKSNISTRSSAKSYLVSPRHSRMSAGVPGTEGNTASNGARGGGVIQAVLFWCLVLEKISKKVRDADGSGTSQAPALAKVSAISFPSRPM